MTRVEPTPERPGPSDDEHDVAEYRQGPVVMRRSRVPRSTTDQRLLDSRGSADWVHTDPWRVMRIQSEFVTGFGALAEVGPAVRASLATGGVRLVRVPTGREANVEVHRRLHAAVAAAVRSVVTP